MGRQLNHASHGVLISVYAPVTSATGDGGASQRVETCDGLAPIACLAGRTDQPSETAV